MSCRHIRPPASLLKQWWRHSWQPSGASQLGVYISSKCSSLCQGVASGGGLAQHGRVQHWRTSLQQVCHWVSHELSQDGMLHTCPLTTGVQASGSVPHCRQTCSPEWHLWFAACREGRVAPVFAHASPENKSASGPVERFAFMLRHHPAYAPLMGHLEAERVQRLQPSESTYMEVVKVTPRAQAVAAADNSSSSGSSPVSFQQQQNQAGEPVLFMWIVSRQPGSSSWANCWMTDAVQMVNVMPAQPPSSSNC